LQQLYDQSRDATFKFKTAFNEVQKKENETEMLRQRYYQMLEVTMCIVYAKKQLNGVEKIHMQGIVPQINVFWDF